MNTIRVGDARELAKDIPDTSIDLVFCDPPYIREHMDAGIYEWLAVTSARVLKPGGFCMAYVGVYWLEEAMSQMKPYLNYFWTYFTLHEELAPTQWNRKTQNRYKPILAYVKGSGAPRQHVMDVIRSTQEKQFHQWGQSSKVARYYIDSFSLPGDTVFDPFCGGATVPYVCKQLGRNFIAFEVEQQTANTAIKRLEQVQMPLFRTE